MAQPGDTQPPAVSPTARGRSAPFLDDPTAPPVTRADGGVWFLYALLGFGIGQVVAYVLAALAAQLAGQGGQLQRIARLAEPPEWYVGVSLVGLWIGFYMGAWLASRMRGTGHLVDDVGLRFRPIDLLGVVVGVAAQFIIDLAYAPFITNPTKFGAPTQRLTGASHGWGFVIIAFMTVVGAPFFEELFFRGLVFRALARGFSPTAIGSSGQRVVGVVAAIAVDGLLFSLAHWELEQFIGLAAFGMVLAFLYYRTNRLGMNMLAHASFNLVAVIAVANSRGGFVH